jgi:hypothetical protein
LAVPVAAGMAIALLLFPHSTTAITGTRNLATEFGPVDRAPDVDVGVQVPALELPAISVEHTANPPLEVLDIVDRDAPGL